MPSLEGGGAERVVSHLCHLWEDEPELEIHLALIYPHGKDAYSLPECIVIHRLNCRRVLSAIWPCYRLIVKLRPDAVFSSMSNVNMLILAIKWWLPGLNVVVRENNLPSVNLKYDNLKTIRKLAYRRLYPLANKIICQSEAMRLDFMQHYPKLTTLLDVISNPVLLQANDFENPFSHMGAGPHIIVVGRLSVQKNCGRAIEIFKNWLPEIPEAHLWFLGEGEDLHALEQQSEKYHLKDRVHFPGFVQPIEAWLTHADLFLMCSKFEGSPNALLEALTLNCPVLVEAHPGGTREMMASFGQEHRYLDKIDTFDSSFLEKSVEQKSRQELNEENSRLADAFLNCFWGSEKL